MNRKFIGYIGVIMVVILIITACGGSEKRDFPDNGKYNVITTTTLIGDLVKNIGGDKVNLEILMGPGVDAHGYKTSAGDVSLMDRADMILYNGLDLEGKIGDVLESLQNSEKLIYSISDNMDEDKLIESIGNHDGYDPHIWFNVKLWEEAALRVKEGLIDLDKENAGEYEKNYEKYLLELEDLDGYIRERVEELPKDKRILVTSHDAFNYFGNEYGFQVRGLQGISTAAEAGTSDVRELANFIVEHEVKSIFIESSMPRNSVNALQEAVDAQGFEVEIGGELYSDSTGGAGTDAETYIGTFKENIDTIVDALK